MRKMAGFVYETCIESTEPDIKPGTQGGWVSKGFSDTTDYLTHSDADIAGFFLEWREYCFPRDLHMTFKYWTDSRESKL